MSIRSYKIFGLSAIDLVLSLIGMIIVFFIAHKVFFNNLDLWKFILAAVLLTIPLGILFHAVFGVNTTLNYKLGLSNKP